LLCGLVLTLRADTKFTPGLIDKASINREKLLVLLWLDEQPGKCAL